MNDKPAEWEATVGGQGTEAGLARAPSRDKSAAACSADISSAVTASL